MKKNTTLLLLLIMVVFPSRSLAACGGASPNLVAASASQSDVMECVDTASNGDTINVPSGDATWTLSSQGCTANTALCIKKAIKLIGGSGGTTTTITLSGSSSDGSIVFQPDSTVSSSGNMIEFTGFTIDCNQQSHPEGALAVNNSNTEIISNVKIHHNTFKNSTGTAGRKSLYANTTYTTSYLAPMAILGCAE